MTKKEHREGLKLNLRVLAAKPFVRSDPDCQQAVYNIAMIMWDMHNRMPIAHGQVTALPVTAAMRALVIWLHAHYPDWNYEQLARFTGLDNIGRISEILHGVRK